MNEHLKITIKQSLDDFLSIQDNIKGMMIQSHDRSKLGNTLMTKFFIFLCIFLFKGMNDVRAIINELARIY
jgi:hypothetical protein